MSPVHDADHDMYDEVPPRSIFAATWFRVVLIVILFGVIGAIAVPYVLDWMNPPIVRAPVAAKPSTPTPASTAPGPSETAPAEKKDSTLIPAPVAPPASAPPPAESKSTPLPATKSAPPSAAKTATPKTEASSAPPPSESKSALTPSEPSKPAVGKPESPAKPDTVAKAPSAASGSSAAKDDAASAPATKTAATAGVATAAATGPFWVQVGAFKDAETARRVATKLREENFKAEESLTRVGGGATAAKGTTSTAKAAAGDTGSDRYDVYVSGPSTDEVNKRLAAKGLVAEPAGAAIVVKPSLPLRDAVALSKDLAAEGFKVQVKRAGGTPAASTAGASAPVANGSTELHRVRVGAFPDRAAAQAAARDLEAKGYKPFIARGDR